MPYKATLELAGKNYDVENCHFSLNQEVNHGTKKPCSLVNISHISLELDVDVEALQVFWAWGKSHEEQKDGKIVFLMTKDDSKAFEFSFWEGYCTSFSYHMVSKSRERMSINIEISSSIVSLDDGKFEIEF